MKKSTIKHMRDAFDPYSSQVRVGWYQRPILRSRANVIQAYEEISEAALAEIVRELLNGSEEAIEPYIAPVSGVEANGELSLDDLYWALLLKSEWSSTLPYRRYGEGMGSQGHITPNLQVYDCSR